MVPLIRGPAQTSKRKGILRSTVLLWVVLALLSGCGPSVPRVLKIGLVAPFEGIYREVGYDAVYGARLAIREINEAGGLGGWRFELVAYDDRGDVALATQVAADLVVDPDVVVVIGHYRSETTTAAASVYAEAALPLITMGGWVGGSGGVWHLVPEPQQFAEAMVHEAHAEMASSSTAAVWGNGPVAEELSQLVSDARGEAADLESVAVAFSLLSPLATAETLVDWRAQGWAGELVGGIDMSASAFGSVAGADGLGARYVTPYPLPRDLETAGAWREAYLAVGPHVPEPGPYALPTYETVYLAAEAAVTAAQGGRRPERDAVTSALGDSRREGLLGEIRWDAEGYWERPCLYVYRWTAGGPALVSTVSPGR